MCTILFKVEHLDYFMHLFWVLKIWGKILYVGKEVIEGCTWMYLLFAVCAP
jgi:hypothetical protein